MRHQLAKSNGFNVFITIQVSYSNTEGDFLPISRYAQERNSRVSVQGNIAFSCQEEINGLISFLSPESFLLVPLWNQTRRGSLQIKFRTTEEVKKNKWLEMMTFIHCHKWYFIYRMVSYFLLLQTAETCLRLNFFKGICLLSSIQAQERIQ